MFILFGSLMMITSLIAPLVSAKRELELGPTVLQVLLWICFSAAWVFQGYLLDRSGFGFGNTFKELPVSARTSRWAEIVFYLLVFGPLCLGYVYVTYRNTEYFGFNYVLLFVLAGFSTLIFRLWAGLLYLVYQWIAWNVVAYLMWSGWWELEDSITMFAGFVFSGMMFYIFRRERNSRGRAFALSAELDEANERLRATRRQVEELAATQERNRIAREIHDTLGHSLTIVNMQIETARALISTDKAKAEIFLEKAQEVTKKGLTEIRSSVASLRSSPLDGRSLSTALEELLFSIRSEQVEPRFEVIGPVRELSQAVEAAIFRLAQEALTNVRKHALASRVEWVLSFSNPNKVSMELSDNGKGCSDLTGGFGIIGIRERIQLLDGEVSFSTSPGNGLQLKIAIPT